VRDVVADVLEPGEFLGEPDNISAWFGEYVTNSDNRFAADPTFFAW